MKRAEWEKSFKHRLESLQRSSTGSTYRHEAMRLIAAVEACEVHTGSLWTIARYTWHGGGSKYESGALKKDVPKDLPFSEEIIKEAMALPADLRCRYVTEQDWKDLAAHFGNSRAAFSKRLLLLETP